MSKGKIALLLIALAAVALSLMNASWLAGTPDGRLNLIAHRGVSQPLGVGADGCSARAMEPGGHLFIENTLPSIYQAFTLGARGLALDLQPTADGRVVVFRDAELECRTNGSGAVAHRPLDYLKGLDVGHGYTADGGETYPLRSRGVGAMPTLDDILRTYPQEYLVFTLGSDEPAFAEAIAETFRRTGVSSTAKMMFRGPAAPVERLSALLPEARFPSREQTEACLGDYALRGLVGLVPESCRDRTLLMDPNGRWTIWGWPYRFIHRLNGADSNILMLPAEGLESFAGIAAPEQLGRVPSAFKGLLLVEDMWNVGRALGR